MTKRIATLAAVILTSTGIGASLPGQRNANAEPPIVAQPDPAYVSTCKWSVASDSNITEDALAYCEEGRKPVMGGCRSDVATAMIYKSHPFENNDETNAPETNELYSNLTEGAGWYCHYSTDSNTVTAFALCCL